MKINNPERIEELLRLTGDEIYQKFGLKRDETITITSYFENGMEMDVKLVICEGTDRPYTEAILFDHGSEVACSQVAKDFFGEWSLCCEGYIYKTIIEKDGTVSSLKIKEERYFVFEEIKNGDSFSDVFDNEEDAISFAQISWDHLTDREKKTHYICVAKMKVDVENPEIPSEECDGYTPIKEWTNG